MGTVALVLPVPVLSVICLESDSAVNNTGAGALRLPTPVLGASGITAAGPAAVVLPLPTPVLQAKGLTPVAGYVGMTFPSPHVVATGKTGSAGAVALTLPMPVLAAAGPNSGVLTLPVPVISAAGRSGYVGSVGMTLPMFALAAAANEPFVGSTKLTLPMLTLTVGSILGGATQVALALPRPVLASQGLTGLTGAVELSLPMLALAANGYGPMIGAGVLALPSLYMCASGTTVSQTSDANGDIKAIVLNTQTGALSQFCNFHFNSFANFNGVCLAASDDGLFTLTGDTDNGVAIPAAARIGLTDFGTSYSKRIDRCYVGYRADGDMILRVVTDETQQRDYLLPAYSGAMNLHGNHVKIGRGTQARYWQFELRNIAGSNFQLNAMELKPTKLRRRIGGGDA